MRQSPAKPPRRVATDTGPPRKCVLKGCEEAWHLVAAGRQLQEPKDSSILGARAKIISDKDIFSNASE